jgi:LysR family transcriptional regulator, transcriptional activator of nhaA
MDWLNYHHLLYFWHVAREGTISRAAEKLHLGQPAISTQLRSLETSLGIRLFHRVGRNLELTEMGRTVFRYADEIFSLGGELLETIRGQSAGKPVRFHVGVVDVVPKLVAKLLIEPALQLPGPMRLHCVEGTQERLLGELALHQLDIVLSDTPVTGPMKFRVFNHLLGESTIAVFGTRLSAFPEWSADALAGTIQCGAPTAGDLAGVSGHSSAGPRRIRRQCAAEGVWTGRRGDVCVSVRDSG